MPLPLPRQSKVSISREDTGLWAYSVRDARNLLKGARSGTTHRLASNSWAFSGPFQTLPMRSALETVPIQATAKDG